MEIIHYLQVNGLKLRLEGNERGLKALQFVDRVPLSAPKTTSYPEPFKAALSWLDSYFQGNKTTPFPLKWLDLSLGTPFQQNVWKALCKIPYGKTISYRELAQRVGIPAGARAVGNANGKNPLPIIIPCHRVIATDGTLGGYSCGLPIKKKLLSLEGLNPNALI